jgi:hypothetical protein
MVTEESWIVTAFPQGYETSNAPAVAILDTRSFSIAQDCARAWSKEGFCVTRKHITATSQIRNDPERFLIGH